MKRLSDAARAAILDDYLSGAPVAQIAARHGVCQSYPSMLAVRRLGAATRRGCGGKRIPPDVEKAVAKAYLASEETIEQICARYGVSKDYPRKAAMRSTM